MSKRAETSITIDFTGEELIEIGKACIREELSFAEFIDYALQKALKESLDIEE
jgi:hypothetical protein